MIFLDPKSDIVFKRLFGDNAHQKIVISFLNSILDRKGDGVIVTAVINDPNNTPSINENKSSIVDVRCTDQAGKHYIVEMQVVTQSYYGMRAQYYASLALSNQLKTGVKYDTLVPVIFVGVLNFNLFENPDYLSHHLILDTKTHKQELNLLEFHFIELKKFHKTIDELATIADRWIYFLGNAQNLESIPENLKGPELKAAFHVLEKSGWKQKDLERYERSLDVIRSDLGRFDAGKIEMQITIVRELLEDFDVEFVAKKTGLSIADVKALQENKGKKLS